MNLKLSVYLAIFCVIVSSSQLHAQVTDDGSVFILYQGGNNQVYMAYGEIGDGNPNDQDQYDSTWNYDITTGIEVADDGVSTTVFYPDNVTPKLMVGAKVKDGSNGTVVQTQVLQTLSGKASTWNSPAVLIGSNRKFSLQTGTHLHTTVELVYGSFIKNGNIHTKQYLSGLWVDTNNQNTKVSNSSGEMLGLMFPTMNLNYFFAAVLKSSKKKGVKFRLIDPDECYNCYKVNWDDVNKNRGISMVAYPQQIDSLVAYTNSSGQGVYRYSPVIMFEDQADWSDPEVIGLSVEGYPVLTSYGDSMVLLAYTDGSRIYLMRGLQKSSGEGFDFDLLRKIPIGKSAKYLSIVQYDATSLK